MSASDVASTLKRDYGKGSVRLPGEEHDASVKAISTGSPQLDIALGVGGVARGRLTEIYGPESSGKTTLIYHLLANAQKEGTCVFIDAEHAADPKYAEAIGVKWDELYFMQPDTAEEALAAAVRFAKSGDVAMIAVDSVAALSPKAELEGEVGDYTVGLLARLMGQTCRLIKGAANQSGTAVVFTNQIREKVGVVFGSPETQPGGRALKFFSSQRLDIRRKETVGAGNESSANRVKVKVVKNKVAPPYREAEFEIAFGIGIDKNAAILDMTTDPNVPGYVSGLVTKAGKYFTFDAIGGAKASSRAEALELLNDNPEAAADLYDKILEANQ